MALYFLINSLAGGGAEKVLLTLAEKIENDGIILLEKDVVYPVNKNRLAFLSSHSTKTNPIYKTFYIPVYTKKLSSIVKDGIIVSFLERANFVNVLAKRRAKHKAVISVRLDVLYGHAGLKTINKPLIRYLYPKADHIVCVSKGVKSSLLKLGIPEKKISVIYNPFDIKSIISLSQEPLEEVYLEEKPYIINIGRLNYQKGQWHLIRIFANLKRKFQDLSLVILGEGELHDYLLELSESLDLKTCSYKLNNLSPGCDVYFLGFKKNPYKYLKNAKLFVFPSLFEGLPGALIEALACGTATIAADCPSGPREVLSPETPVNIYTQVPEFATYGVLMPRLEGVYLKANEPLTKTEIVWISTLENLLKDENRLNCYRALGPKRAEDFEVDKIMEEWKKLIGKNF